MRTLGIGNNMNNYDTEILNDDTGEELEQEQTEINAEASSLPDEPVSWLDDASQEFDDVEVGEYDIVSSPNDWNFTTIVNFIDSGALKIPAFQRNYVWDKKRASKLIESLLIGLPVPQVFLYEESRNSFLVIDGQQRLLTLYFYANGRFPKSKTRGELRQVLSEGLLNEDVLADDKYFEPFGLVLQKSPNGKPNRYHGLTYKGLREDRTSLNLRTIRNMVVKQTSPEGNSAVFEIFSRLNTGGVNLSPQEIRASLYHSQLFAGVLRVNDDPSWRKLVGQESPDPRMRDTEFLLRGLALARGSDGFRGSLAGFINKFCSEAKSFTTAQTTEAIDDLTEFVHLFVGQTPDIFMRASKFSGVLFEAFFAAWVREGRPDSNIENLVAAIGRVKSSSAFANTLQEGSTKSANVKARIKLAETAIKELS